MRAVLYIHGKGGSAQESEHYKSLFSDSEVFGLDYKENVPWKVCEEIKDAIADLKERFEKVVLIANSIGAFFSIHSDIEGLIERAYFISPIVDMEGLILGMMKAENVTEEELKEKGVIPTSFGEDLSWEYLQYVRNNPVKWSVQTHVLYGQNDVFTPFKVMKRFADTHNATLTVMECGEHWFHTDAQMDFLDRWILNYEDRD